MRLAGKVAIVTGGTRGLGRAIAEAYVKEGCQVVCAAREAGPDGAGDLAFRQVDVRDPASVRALMRTVYDAYGRLDLLVANAGVSRPGPSAELAPQDWAEVIDTNLNGTFLCAREAVPYLEKDGGGRIVTMSSALATRVARGSAAYASSKAAIEMFTRVAAVEFAPRGITVNCLSPGFIDEGMGRELARNERLWSHYGGKISVGRAGGADDVARAALFLAVEDSAYVNGHVLEVNGGLSW
ncbi:SDR family NAD(P)-dependent oxidoreductase [Actinacidiphila rubida]|uniref:Glucose 1-dehydrogenase n=1 Tax=Actinacidiphila rubida TaxID=310780 RepID=A0A1H8EIC4_9ACTN|nr:SDR family NAD(P)-dependent oxidoreductase [Actinacidiphila rubida]SEN18627.1 glucose 1-dehydrogenase [Actinacidiphila rubida]